MAKILIVRTVTAVMMTDAEKNYPGMTAEEALAFEQGALEGEILETVMDAPNQMISQHVQLLPE